MKNLDRAIDLAEEHCGSPLGEARDELEATRVKTRAFDLLWERAHTVIATFEDLGKTRSVPEQLTPHKPLFGHPSGKRAATHWITFMKEPRNDD